MAITLIQSKTNPITVHQEFSTTTSPSLTLTSTPVQYNLLICAIYGTAVGQTFTAPSDWTMAIQFNGSKAIGGVGIMYKVAGASESTTVNPTMTSASGAMVAYEYSGLNNINPLDRTASAERSTSGTNLNVPTSTGTKVDSELAIAVWGAGGAINNWSMSGGFTSDYNALEGALGSGIFTVSNIVTASLSWTNGNFCSGAVATFRALHTESVINNYQFVSAGDGMSVSEKIR